MKNGLVSVFTMSETPTLPPLAPPPDEGVAADGALADAVVEGAELAPEEAALDAADEAPALVAEVVA
jgi:hypothetical protein